MKSALFAVVGVSLLAATAACDGGSETPSGPVMSGGTGGSTAGTGALPMAGSSGAGTSGSGTGGTGGGSTTAGVPLTPTNGWIAADTNAIMVQGAMFSFADPTTTAGPPMMAEDFTLGNACIKGVAAKVDKTCTPPAGMDCFGVFWGAAIGLNLNQPEVDDPANPGMKIGGAPVAFDASAITGFAFDIVPPAGGAGMIPTALRFKVDEGDNATEYCTGGETPIKPGENVVTFDKLRTKCWEPTSKQPMPVTAATAKTKLVKISWQIPTKESGTTPFDFCVANIRALQ